MKEEKAERERMVARQIRPRGIDDQATLNAMLEVPRHLFVPSALRSAAYEDGPLPIGEGQTISQPYIVALMTQAAELDRESVVLEIGTGSGYGAAVLSRLAKEVYTVERIPALAIQAEKVLKECGYDNVHVKVENGTLGWPDKGPYDAILVTAGAPFVPEPFSSQLKTGACDHSGRGCVESRITKVAQASFRSIYYRKIGVCSFCPFNWKRGVGG